MFMISCFYNNEIIYHEINTHFVIPDVKDRLDNLERLYLSTRFFKYTIYGLEAVNTIDVLNIGEYVIRYYSSYSDGSSESMMKRVIIFDDTKPVLTIIGDSVMNHPIDTEFVDPGATILDNSLEEIDILKTIYLKNHFGRFVPIDSIDIECLGEYLITYSATDSSGNKNSVSRRVFIVERPVFC